MTAIEQLQTLIRDKEVELQALRTALRTIMAQADGPNGREETRFRGMSPLEAIRQVLKDHPEGLSREKLTEILIAGGQTHGKKRAHHNIRLSIDLNHKIGNLMIEGDHVRLPGTTSQAES